MLSPRPLTNRERAFGIFLAFLALLAFAPLYESATTHPVATSNSCPVQTVVSSKPPISLDDPFLVTARRGQ